MKIIKNGIPENNKEIKFKCPKCGCVFSEMSSMAKDVRRENGVLKTGILYKYRVKSATKYTSCCPMEFCDTLCSYEENPMKAVKTVSYGNWDLRK